MTQHIHTDCRSEEGVTVGLIDSLISIARILVERDMSSEAVQNALRDMQYDDDMKRLMDIGELGDAKAHIKKQEETIKMLTVTLEPFLEAAKAELRVKKVKI